MITFDELKQLAINLPEICESTSYGTPALKVRGKLLARMWPDNDVLVVKVSLEDQEMLLKTEPDVYFLTDHYVGYPCILVRLDKVNSDDLRDLLTESWRQVAPARLVETYRRAVD